METTPNSSSARTRKAHTKKAVDSKSGKRVTQSIPTSAAKSATAAASAPKRAAAKPHGRKATIVVTESLSAIAHSEAELTKMIAEAAYYLAEQRNFAAGGELHDWITAEQQIRRQYQHA